MRQQKDLLDWMDKKPTLEDCKRRRLHSREIYDMARRGELDLTREDVLDIHYGSSDLGQFFTPDPIARFVASLAEIQPDEVVLDPCAGLGNLMLPALEYTDKVKGIELVYDTMQLATHYLGLDIVRGDAFEVDWPACDVIVLNPPFGRFRGGKPKWYPFKGQGRLEVAFVWMALNRVKRRLVSIVPNSLLANRDDLPIRKYMLDNYGLIASFGLPAKSFWKSTREINKWRWPTTTTETGILVVDKEQHTDENYGVFMGLVKTVDDLPEMLRRFREFIANKQH